MFDAGIEWDRSVRIELFPKSSDKTPSPIVLGKREGEAVASQTDMEAMYRRHIGTVYRLCYSFLGSAAEAEDAEV